MVKTQPNEFKYMVVFASAKVRYNAKLPWKTLFR